MPLTSHRLLAASLFAAACSPPATPAATATLETIPETMPADGVLVTIGGDCSFARGVADRAAHTGWPTLLGDAAPLLRAADLAIVDLESPLAPCLPDGTLARPRLCGDPAAVEALRAAGVDAVTLANNHALDAGSEGLRATATALAARGIASLGASEVTGGRPAATPLGPIAVVAANLTPAALAPQSRLALPSPDRLAAAIADSRQRDPDRPVLVLLHLGRELDQSAGPRERRYVRAAIAAGAAAVILSGAHVMRAQLLDHGVPVHLGLGNLVFDQHDPRTRRGALITLRMRPGRAAQPIATACIDSLTGDRLDCDQPTD